MREEGLFFILQYRICEWLLSGMMCKGVAPARRQLWMNDDIFLKGVKWKARRFLSHSFLEWISGSKLRELVTRIMEGWLGVIAGYWQWSRFWINVFARDSALSFAWFYIIYWFIVRVCSAGRIFIFFRKCADKTMWLILLVNYIFKSR